MSDHDHRAKRTWLLCDCEGSQTLDGEAMCGAKTVYRALCQGEADVLAKEIAQAKAEGRALGVACAQERAIFEDMAAELDAPAPMTADIRDRAGWSDEGGRAAAKQAALLAVAELGAPAAPVIERASDGVCLVYGRGDVALEAGRRLADRLDVTVMLTDAAPDATRAAASEPIDIVAGRVRSAAGALGDFALVVDAFAEFGRGGRTPGFGERRDGAKTQCDVVVDLSGDAALFPAPHKRDGYLRADPGDPLAVERALFDAADLRGVFDKTLFIRLEESLCAHQRALKPGCSRCLNLCPTGAITVGADGKADHVSIDPAICAGCGACAAACPSDAITYDAPGFPFVLRQLTTLIETYEAHGGAAPRVLFHDGGEGRDLIAAAARFSRGLPADVLPLEIDALARVNHPLLLAAAGLGARQALVLAGPKTEAEPIAAQIALAETLFSGAARHAAAGGARFGLISERDPDALCDALYADAPEAHGLPKVLALGEGRALARHVLAGMAGADKPAAIDLSGVDPMPVGGAPYAAVVVDQSACTLCLACAGLCPSGALGDNPDAPELRFQESACLNCGICSQVCPENAITLQPQMDLSDAAAQWRVLKAEEPFACIECGKEFGVKSTVERIAEKLGGQHWMYTNSDNIRLIQMCDDCRVKAQFHAGAAPFQMPTPRRPQRTTDGYFKEREDGEA